MSDHKMDEGHVRPMLESDLDAVLSWRNHPDIKRHMYTQHDISAAEHKNWFANASNDSKYDLLIFELNARPQGFVQFKQRNNGAVADWGFYLAPEAEKGCGQKLGMAALNYAFLEKHFHKVCGETLSVNEKSIKFHLSLGFKQEGLLREHHFDGSNYHDICCYGLLSADWQRL